MRERMRTEKMIYLYGGILAAYLLLLILAAGEKIEEGKLGGKRGIFQKAAVYLLRRSTGHGRGKKKNGAAEKMGKGVRELGQKFQTLEPGANAQARAAEFQIERCALILRIGLGGTLVCLAVWVWGQTQKTLEEGGVPRAEYGQGEQEIVLKASIEGEGMEEVIPYVVEEREYTEKELEEMYQSSLAVLEREMLGENEDFQNVRNDLTLPSSLDGFPFVIAWDSDRYELVDMDGKVENAELSEDEIVTLTARYTYLQWKREYPVYVRVRPAQYTKEGLWQKRLKDALEEADDKTRNSTWMELPANVAEQRIFWERQQEEDGAVFLLLVALTGVLVYWAKDKELDQRLQKRQQELLLDYPEIVNKLTLYMGAGMTIRNAFMKLGEDYRKTREKERRYVYEEILLTCYELQSGRSEVEAYDHFGRRCQLQSYIRLSTLLSQNLRKGSNDLLSVLRREVVDAFAERKKLARKLGEEAGTKLLIPMMLMLCIVMVIIMVPAYFSFSM